MYETCGATVTVTDYDSDRQSDILALLKDKGYVCSVERGVITAECGESLPCEGGAEELPGRLPTWTAIAKTSTTATTAIATYRANLVGVVSAKSRLWWGGLR